MGSLVPFLDLNLLPDPPISTAADNSFKTPLLRPKIEPKAEPFDYSFPQTPSFPNLIPSSPPTPFPDSVDSDFANSLALQSLPSSQDGNVYSEFARVSEMFRSAFGESANQQGSDAGNQQGSDAGNQQGSDAGALNPETGAIVPVPPETAVSVPNYKKQKRSNELVRVTNLSNDDHRYFRDVVRRTRMLYDSLRLFAMYDEEKRQGFVGGRMVRGDLRAAVLMRERGLWLNRDKRIVGSIPGVYVGDLFFYRMELCAVGLHGQTQAGIDYLTSSDSSNGEPIATSIIVSGGYEDDDDSGEVLIYTGHGGRDKMNKPCCDQKLESGNLALERSMHYGIEIRVMRGFKYEGSLTSKVYVYDGLYRIVNTWFEVGKKGFGVFKFKLVRMEGQVEMGTSNLRYAQTLRTKPLQLRPKGYLTLDLSLKKDKVPIFLFNDVDAEHDPLCYEYLAKTIFPPFLFHSSGNVAGCSCVSGCSDNCLCAMKNGGEVAYDHHGFLLRGKPVIFECGPNCSCPPNCRNRVSQRGLRHRLEVFRSRETGWGVRTLDLIHAGSFICEYAGVVLNKEQAQVFSMTGDCLIYPGRFAPRWAEWGDLSQIFSDYVMPSEPSIPPLDFAMDVSSLRNVACYMSHSNFPNVMVQFVLYDHSNLMFPHIMLFALENIPPMKELSIDYGVPDEYTGKLSICQN